MTSAIVREELEAFFCSYPKITARPGEILIRPDQPVPGIYFLRAGLVSQYTISPQGDTLVIHTYKPGSFFPLPWAVNDTPVDNYFETTAAAELYLCPKLDTVDFLKTRPDVLYNLAARLLQGISGLTARMETLVLAPARPRILSLLSYLAKNFGQTEKDRSRINLRLTHREIAAWIGTSRETASIEVKKLEKEGIIERQGHNFIIRSLRRLETELALVSVLVPLALNLPEIPQLG